MKGGALPCEYLSTTPGYKIACFSCSWPNFLMFSFHLILLTNFLKMFGNLRVISDDVRRARNLRLHHQTFLYIADKKVDSPRIKELSHRNCDSTFLLNTFTSQTWNTTSLIRFIRSYLVCVIQLTAPMLLTSLSVSVSKISILVVI